jgi:hypothetical protein
MDMYILDQDHGINDPNPGIPLFEVPNPTKCVDGHDWRAVRVHPEATVVVNGVGYPGYLPQCFNCLEVPTEDLRPLLDPKPIPPHIPSTEELSIIALFPDDNDIAGLADLLADNMRRTTCHHGQDAAWHCRPCVLECFGGIMYQGWECCVPCSKGWSGTEEQALSILWRGAWDAVRIMDLEGEERDAYLSSVVSDYPYMAAAPPDPPEPISIVDRLPL